MVLTDLIGVLVLGMVFLRLAWLFTHPANHAAALRPARWAHETERVLHRTEGRPRP